MGAFERRDQIMLVLRMRRKETIRNLADEFEVVKKMLEAAKKQDICILSHEEINKISSVINSHST